MDFAFFLAPIILSPGPNNILFSILGSETSLRRVIPFLIATNFTGLFYLTSVAFFTATINPFVEDYGIVLTWVGASYLLYLAYRLWIVNSNLNTSFYCPNFWEGLLFGFSNYKVIYAVLLAQAFWQNNYGNLTYSTIPIFILIFASMGVFGHLLWFYSGFFLGKMERFAKFRQRLFSVLLVSVAIWLVVAK